MNLIDALEQEYAYDIENLQERTVHLQSRLNAAHSETDAKEKRSSDERSPKQDVGNDTGKDP